MGEAGSRGQLARHYFAQACINISPANARWFYDNFGPGDHIIVKNSTGT